jgi:small glutamine-rich tetratricopeptide repeat-containing protein alpha
MRADYPKAYSRKGMAHLELQEYQKAIKAYEKVLELDPKNGTAGEHLAHAKSKMAQGTAPRGMPAGMPAGMPDMSGMMNNPAMQQAAQSFMGGGGMDPNMMQNMMQNPEVRRTHSNDSHECFRC